MTKTNQAGFSHHILLPILVVIVVGAIGVLTLMRSNAATNSVSNIPTQRELALYAKEDNVKDDAPSDVGFAELESENTIIKNLGNAQNSASNLTIGSWNVYMGNTKKNVLKNIPKVLQKVDILGVQEGTRFGSTIANKLACPNCAYEMYPKAKGSPKKVAIVWHKSRFTLLASGYEHLSTQGTVKKYAVWLKLQQNASQKVFYMLNTHFPFNATTPTGGLQNDADGVAYKEHMQNMATLITKMQAEGLPIFLTGDINADYRTDKCNTLALPCQSLGKNLAMKSGWEYLNLKGMSGSTGTASSTRIIDYVFSWNRENVTYESMKIIYGAKGKGWGGSDHKPIALTLSIGKQGN